MSLKLEQDKVTLRFLNQQWVTDYWSVRSCRYMLPAFTSLSLQATCRYIPVGSGTGIGRTQYFTTLFAVQAHGMGM